MGSEVMGRGEAQWTRGQRISGLGQEAWGQSSHRGGPERGSRQPLGFRGDHVLNSNREKHELWPQGAAEFRAHWPEGCQQRQR